MALAVFHGEVGHCRFLPGLWRRSLFYLQTQQTEDGQKLPGRQVAAKLLLSYFSHVRLCATPWRAAHPAPPSLGFSRQEHWSVLQQGLANYINSLRVKPGPHPVFVQPLRMTFFFFFNFLRVVSKTKEYDRSRMWCLRLKPGLFTIWPFTGKKTANTCPTALCVVN